MTTEGFVRELCIKAGMEQEGIFRRGRKEGWLEAEDEVFKDLPLTRKNAARICHMYLLKVMKVRDLDIRGAAKLRDLYDRGKAQGPLRLQSLCRSYSAGLSARHNGREEHKARWRILMVRFER